MRIEPLSWKNVRQAAILAGNVFRGEQLSPGFAFWTSLLLPNLMLHCAGYSNLEYWVAMADDGDCNVLGTTGLYSTRRDHYEARWLGWFCVAPEQRGQGIGARLLDHTIAMACHEGAGILRVETSDDPNETAAQRLYESRGLMVANVQSTNRGYSKVYRERLLSTTFLLDDGSNPKDRALPP